MEYKLENQPKYRQDLFAKEPERFELAKKYNDKLFKMLGGNPNEMAKGILLTIVANYERRKKGQKAIPFTPSQSKFMKEVPFEKYLALTTEMVNDPLYKAHSGPIEVAKMDQHEDPEGWMNNRRGIHDGYRKYAPVSPSGVLGIANPYEVEFEYQSYPFIKRKMQGIPVEGNVKPFDEHIAYRGHKAEPYIREDVPYIFKEIYDVDLDVYPEPEVLVEHCVFGDFLHGNTDGVAFNLETGEFEGIEIKTTDAMTNMKKVIGYKEGAVPSAYLAQIACYMSIMNYDVFNLTIGWGLGWKTGMTGIRIFRDLDAEANLLARILWFAIEIVIKDGDITPYLDEMNPSLLLKDLYTIYGPAEEGKAETVNDPVLYSKIDEYIKLEGDIEVLKETSKRRLADLEEQKDAIEAELLGHAKDAEKLIIKNFKGEQRQVYFRNRKTTRFSTKLYDELIKDYKKGLVTKEEFEEKIKNKKALSTTSTSRSMKIWAPKK